MITIFKTGEFDYSDMDDVDLKKKPVKYNVNDLLDVASRTARVNITDGHSKEVIGVMSNFIVEDGLLKADEPNNLELKGMGFSPVFNESMISSTSSTILCGVIDCITLYLCSSNIRQATITSCSSISK